MKLTGNPLVVRFARSGFRKGKTSFHAGVMWVLLALILLINTAFLLARDSLADSAPYPDFRTYCTSLFYQLFVFNAVNLFFLGWLRVHHILSREKAEGTLEFLKISTMTPLSILWGAVIGLQLPGILFLMVTLPISVLCTLGGGVSYSFFFASHIFLIAATAVVSLGALNLGLRLEKRSGDAFVALFTIFLIGSANLMRIGALSGVWDFFHLLNPVGIYLNFAAVGDFGGEFEFFDHPVQPLYVAVVFYVFLGLCLSACALRFLVLGDRYRSSLPWSLFGYAGTLFFVHALIPDPAMTLDAGSRAVVLVLSLFLLLYLPTGRLMHGEHYLLSKSFEAPGGGRHPARVLLRDFLPFALVHVVSDVSLYWRASSEIDLLPSVITVAPAAATLLTGGAVALGVWATPRRGFFWLVLLIPIVIGAAAGAITQSGEVMLMLMSASPPVLGVVLAMREAAPGGGPDLPAILPVALGLAALFTFLLATAGFLAGQGYFRSYERVLLRLRTGESETGDGTNGSAKRVVE